jgi:hypothetical protein
MRALSLSRLGDPSMLVGLVFLGGLAALGGLVAATLRAPGPHVCAVSVPARSSPIGAVVELQERLDATDCRPGDSLAVLGDIHLHAIARFCDLNRPVTFKPAATETGRPTGALCAYGGALRPLRGA